ncbi:30S ribosomal protein S14 [Candidatus Cytomitobacter indipagum]|uniref:Small ribosomal subunit protein uS14 n=1 Tax=Candidatus Cytomitobacter indipagum TaxID=2601575 RepID=A0A5C0UGS5_9PROT|nr:30S ribosomal protein S14 [Candidatus Cytomitobacter indipagum]QEK38234.1 30S ribosomal protein S14 [Candidatus Cytomitobacter indipagum]
MSKTSMIYRNLERLRLSKKYEAKRKELKKLIKDPNLDWKEKMEAMNKLNDLPRKSIGIRYRRRCALTGRPRGVHREFGICRNKIRELAVLGYLPGVEQASW